MNASFLLMTASLLTGQNVVQVNHPVQSAPVVSSSSDCGCTQSSHGFSLGLKDRLRGVFSRHSSSCDSCQPCAAPAPAVHHAPKVACAPACDPCGHTSSFQLFGKLRGVFHRNSASCDGGCSSGCDSGCAGTATSGGMTSGGMTTSGATTGGCAPSTAPPPPPETVVNPPKKMPAPPEKGKDVPKDVPPAKTVFSPAPLAPANSAPAALEVVNPAPPAAGNLRRDPF